MLHMVHLFWTSGIVVCYQTWCALQAAKPNEGIDADDTTCAASPEEMPDGAYASTMQLSAGTCDEAISGDAQEDLIVLV